VKYDDFFKWHEILSKDSTPKADLAWNLLTRALRHLQAVANAQAEQPKPLAVLRWARSLSASDPRDMIFGLLGLSDNFKSWLPPPDYNKSTAQVFTDVAKRHLNLTKSLDILEHASSTTPNLDRPSWVPYWSNAPALFIAGDESRKRAETPRQ